MITRRLLSALLYPVATPEDDDSSERRQPRRRDIMNTENTASGVVGRLRLHRTCIQTCIGNICAEARNHFSITAGG
ncbi:hypothetical protein F5Y04DRAFT_183181 [Hypomontagnella monticulosa]|nr:hypothetical protein F5Y04DRAFT_183181 [Hypomontagnella monticulosa]